MINSTLTAGGKVTYSTDETFYHVFVPELGWLGEVRIDSRTGGVIPSPNADAYTHEQPYAHIFSRSGALKCAEEMHGLAYRVTRTGKLQRIR